MPALCGLLIARLALSGLSIKHLDARPTPFLETGRLRAWVLAWCVTDIVPDIITTATLVAYLVGCLTSACMNVL